MSLRRRLPARLLPSLLGSAALFVAGANAQTATQIVLGNPSTGQGTPLVIDDVGHVVGNHVLTRSTTFEGDTAEATNTTSWDLNPEAGRFTVQSRTDYNGWLGSGISLDTRYAFGVFDTFTVNSGNSGLANGSNVQLNLALTIDVWARTDAVKFQTGSNWLTFTVQQRDPVPGYLGHTYSDERFSLDYEVTVYEFVEEAVIDGVTQFDNTVTYVNGQGAEADLYNFNITVDAVVGETIELGMLLGDFNPNVYDYDIANLMEGTRQTLGNGQTDFSNAFSANMVWDLEEVEGFEGLEVLAASGFNASVNGLSAVPEPSTYAALFGAGALGFAVWHRRRQRTSFRAVTSTATTA
ncbi:PEP-CTERM sorting domain-containing protein [Actomonas aquatica]|uniref:PEP-CTERM sorting domain-containing protein n=1 Tax=Actomonas aquatica TaxID=2866162 RepID=A0ABZ1C6N6_9BACT|nr:PEP-CTERM sorting domain-containing protein [Opitutus sp. WL0086]WRQ85980.1 PEP-CTERM sorting domain-containing protein [Opitutus sp. WL0086]